MKKIATKIVLLSLINTLIVAILNVGASLYMNATQAVGSAAGEAIPADAAGAGGVGGGAPVSNSSFMIPTPILYGLLGSLVLGVIVSYILGKFISKPIVKVTELTDRLSRLDLKQDSAYEELLKYRDETGAMSHALSNTRNALETMASRLTSISGSVQLHAKDLSHSADNNVESVSQVVRTIDEVARGNSSQAQSISEITSTLSEVTQLMNSAAAEARLNSDNAGKSFVMIEAGEKAVNSQAENMKDNIKVSQDASRSIEELSAMIDRISDILTLITSITNQTNLLALNAAIESARAGEAGKGFAVVADEVRKLAEESANAAKSIVEIIKQIKDKTSDAVHQMNSSKTLIDEQKQALGITQDAFSKIRGAYEVILEGFNQTAGAMESVNDKSGRIYEQIQDMAAIAQQTSASMEEVSASGQQQLASIEVVARSSRDLLQLSEELNTQTGLFVF